MTAREEALKLREEEYVLARTIDDAFAFCKQANLLGCCWNNGNSYAAVTHYGPPVGVSRWDVWYDLHHGSLRYQKPAAKIISTTEWLNRHGVFVAGQSVVVGGARYVSLGGDAYVHPADVQNHERGAGYRVCVSKVRSPFPDFTERQVLVQVDGQAYSVSPETSYAIQQILDTEIARDIPCLTEHHEKEHADGWG